MPAAILLHGHYLGAWAWDRVRVALEGMAWVIRADALQGSESPWTGAGPHPAGEVSLGMQIAQVAAVVRAMPEPAVVVAHSYSGLILQALLGERDSRERIKAAVFLDATVGRPGDSLLTILDRAVPGDSPRSGIAASPALPLCPLCRVSTLRAHRRMAGELSGLGGRDLAHRPPAHADQPGAGSSGHPRAQLSNRRGRVVIQS
jgi:hypothetical protein